MLICYGSWGKSLSARGYLGVGSLKLWVGGWVFKCRQWVGLFFRKIYILRRKFISGFVAVFLKLFMDLVASVVSRMLSLTKSAGRRHVLWFNSMGWFMVFPTSDAARAKVAVGTNMSVILAPLALNHFATFMWFFYFNFGVKNGGDRKDIVTVFVFN